MILRVFLKGICWNILPHFSEMGLSLCHFKVSSAEFVFEKNKRRYEKTVHNRLDIGPEKIHPKALLPQMLLVQQRVL